MNPILERGLKPNHDQSLIGVRQVAMNPILERGLKRTIVVGVVVIVVGRDESNSRKRFETHDRYSLVFTSAQVAMNPILERGLKLIINATNYDEYPESR